MDADLTALCADIGDRLRSEGGRLVTVESCTGGGIAWHLTSVPGSSHWFERALVTYSNQAKTDLAAVSPELIAAFGAVSEQTARAMAAGGAADPSASHALSVTGIAGPGGGSPDKPVGTVCFAWALPDGGSEGSPTGCLLHSDTRRFEGDRASVRMAAVRHALSRLRELLV